ncbi:hypothetical protein H5410_010600 [Solanum commersonii]|uniref:Uncharacterized protein n=1 Tax=Solanum commersonii TaxID=4109 RepID=A0A9J6AL72_SOLCO|nr:hypothetical protein H5410_010600 [Solanum commersonii]
MTSDMLFPLDQRKNIKFNLFHITQKALRWPLEQSVAQDSIFKRNLEFSLQLNLTRFHGNRYHVDCKGTEKHASYENKIKRCSLLQPKSMEEH